MVLAAGPGRRPLLARMLAAPLVIDVRPGAIARLSALLADRRIATEGRVAVR
jgi:glycerol-1-phosphate dehydrogenase [NAD(P)+]